MSLKTYKMLPVQVDLFLVKLSVQRISNYLRDLQLEHHLRTQMHGQIHPGMLPAFHEDSFSQNASDLRKTESRRGKYVVFDPVE
jgi:hypothetical protein